MKKAGSITKCVERKYARCLSEGRDRQRRGMLLRYNFQLAGRPCISQTPYQFCILIIIRRNDEYPIWDGTSDQFSEVVPELPAITMQYPRLILDECVAQCLDTVSPIRTTFEVVDPLPGYLARIALPVVGGGFEETKRIIG